ncbi:MAG: dTDP-4-dehydrorhamnose 3,5-epimerase family protein [Bacteroidota bacterium]
MNSHQTEIPGVILIDNFTYDDERGGFIKAFSADFFELCGLSFIPREFYYSISKKNVIRGMHFQIPPKEHAKLIFVLEGAILDVVLDLRKSSPMFGKSTSYCLAKGENSIYIPPGCAHGFKSLHENTITFYSQTSCYSKEHDTGVLWNSFGFDWGVGEPIVSERDKSFKTFNNFTSPFIK